MRSDKNTAERFIRIALPSTTSTMDDARRLAALHPCGAVRADYQSAGRGRLAGRSWSSERGQGLSCTVWMTLERYAASAGQGGAPPPLAAGLALRRALLAWAAGAGARFPGGISLKWPNDLLCAERKVAGILCEGAGSSILMGFGVNLAQSSFSDGYRSPPSSVLLECGAAPDKDLLVDLILDELSRPGLASRPWLEEANEALAWKGLSVSFWPGLGSSAPVRGMLRGLDGSGAVVLLVDGRELAYVSGELRPDSY
jgi:BirA family biotin operon repressor/biotin-[acetyl-CoA-carboxylase] ligase